MCGFLLIAPYWGPGPQPRQVPWLGIKWVTLWFTGQHSIHWAPPARADSLCIFNLWHFTYDVSRCGPLCIPLVCETLCFLDLHVYFLHLIRGVLLFFKSISSFLLFLFSSWQPYDPNVGMREVIPEGAYTILIFLDSFFFLLSLVVLCFLMFQIVDMTLGFIYSTVVSL